MGGEKLKRQRELVSKIRLDSHTRGGTSMHRVSYCLGVIALLFLSFLLFSCDVNFLTGNDNINNYIYPYLEFTPTEGAEGYTVTVVDGAALEALYIPSEIEIDGVVQPVLVFGGFQNSEDVGSLKNIGFESSRTKFSSQALEQAERGSFSVKYDEVEEEEVGSTKWELPVLENTYEGEFLGWTLTGTDTPVQSGDVMIPGYTDVSPRWGKHSYSEEKGRSASCTRAGWTDYEVCENCGYSTKIELPVLGHDFPLTEHAAAGATCVSVGYTSAWYECERCGSAFSDSSAETALDVSTIEIPVIGHTPDGSIYKNATQHWWHCRVEDIDYGHEAHTFSEWRDSQDGLHRERVCSVCQYKETAEINHTWVKVEAVAATCTQKGHKVYWKCSTHEGEYSLTDPSTSTTDISIINETTLQAETDIAMLSHALSAWQTDGTYHWKTCSSCGETFDKGEHTFEHTFIAQEDRALVIKERCSVCEKEKTPQASASSAFEITAVFGEISAKKTDDNTWSLSYTGSGADCYWTNEKGEVLISGRESFSVTRPNKTEKEIKLFCHILDARDREIDMAIAVLPKN